MQPSAAIETLTRDAFMQRAEAAGTRHWKNAESRWAYHEAAIAIIRRLALPGPASVLELGTMGISLVTGSDTMDYAEKWNGVAFAPTYAHDARVIPWPIPDRRYHLLVALRVFHHLRPVQAACFREAKRIARNIIIVTPTDYQVRKLRETSGGVSEAEVIAWNGGVPPTEARRFGDWRGNLYFWDEAALA